MLSEFGRDGQYLRKRCKQCMYQQQQSWRKAHPDKIKEYNDNRSYHWRDKNPVAAKANVNAYRRRVRQAAPPWVNWGQIKNIYKEAQESGLSVDHIIPLHHPLVCGLHVPWNLQLISLAENCSKSNQFTPE